MAVAPVIAIDGPSASGKGTVAQLVAESLGFHYLNSGVLYRLVALCALREGVSWDQEPRLAALAAALDVDFQGKKSFLNNKEVTDQIQTEDIAAGASRVALLPAIRVALLARQRSFLRSPGLVAEGRDMASIVFPQAELKIFLTATAEERAVRRYKQLKQKGIAATLPALLQELRERDARDAARSVAPLKQCPDARLVDTTAISAKDAAKLILAWYRSAGG